MKGFYTGADKNKTLFRSTDAAIAGEIGKSRTVRGCAAASSHSSKEIVKLTRPFSSKVATSHKLTSQRRDADREEDRPRRQQAVSLNGCHE